jgi:peptidoglycan/LPS O-acetylase OafA/YrhL
LTVENAGEQPPPRFYSLDALRGVAALSVVVWHWHHFTLGPDGARTRPMESQPLYPLLFVFYRRGELAVDLFFSLSGFIFFWLYSTAVAERALTAREFWVRRFSRLYPLHLVTLLFVAAGQLLFERFHGRPFVYPENDLRHFLLQLSFASSWGLERGFSFNGPIWSVSVEVLLYAAFFIFCSFFRPRIATALAVAVTGFAFARIVYEPVGRGVGSFFVGGAAYLVYLKILEQRRVRALAVPVALLAGALWVSVVAGMSIDGWPGPGVARSGVYRGFVWLWPRAVLFPVTILALSLIETSRGSFGRSLSLLGDVSYSSYLLHYPLQLVVMSVVLEFSAGTALFDSPWLLLGFYALLVPLSLVSHRCFELPAQRLLRGRTAAVTRTS